MEKNNSDNKKRKIDNNNEIFKDIKIGDEIISDTDIDDNDDFIINNKNSNNNNNNNNNDDDDDTMITTPITTPTTTRWYWLGDSSNGKHQDVLKEYEETINNEIENQYQSYINDPKLSIYKLDNDRYIDFIKMSQIRYDNPKKFRAIKRLSSNESISINESPYTPKTIKSYSPYSSPYVPHTLVGSSSLSSSGIATTIASVSNNTTSTSSTSPTTTSTIYVPKQRVFRFKDDKGNNIEYEMVYKVGRRIKFYSYRDALKNDINEHFKKLNMMVHSKSLKNNDFERHWNKLYGSNGNLIMQVYLKYSKQTYRKRFKKIDNTQIEQCLESIFKNINTYKQLVNNNNNNNNNNDTMKQ